MDATQFEGQESESNVVPGSNVVSLAEARQAQAARPKAAAESLRENMKRNAEKARRQAKERLDATQGLAHNTKKGL